MKNILIRGAVIASCFLMADSAHATSWNVLPGEKCGAFGQEVSAVMTYGFGVDGLKLCSTKSLKYLGTSTKPNSCSVYAPLTVIGNFQIPTQSCPGASNNPVRPLPSPVTAPPVNQADMKTIYSDFVIDPVSRAAMDAWEDTKDGVVSVVGRENPPYELIEATIGFLEDLKVKGLDVDIKKALESGQEMEVKSVVERATKIGIAFDNLKVLAEKHGYESTGISIAADAAKYGGVSSDIIGVQFNFDNEPMLAYLSQENKENELATSIPHRLVAYSSAGLTLGAAVGYSGNIVAQLNQDFNICTSGPSVGAVVGFGGPKNIEMSVTVDWPRDNDLLHSKHTLPDFAVAVGAGKGFELEATGIYTWAYKISEREKAACDNYIFPSSLNH